MGIGNKRGTFMGKWARYIGAEILQSGMELDLGKDFAKIDSSSLERNFKVKLYTNDI